MSSPRFFAGLPADVNNLIARKLNYRQLNAVMASAGGMHFVHNLRNNQHNLIELAGSSRADFRTYLRYYFADGSENLKTLAEAAIQDGANPYDYALYALVSDVAVIDRFKLRAAISALSQDARVTSILPGLNIIDCYLTSKVQENARTEEDNLRFEHDLHYLIEHAGTSYINLRGAQLRGDFQGLDLSFADLRGTHFVVDARNANLTCADLSNAILGAHLRLDGANTEGVIRTGISLGDTVIVQDFDMIREGFDVLDPEETHILIAQVYDDQKEERQAQDARDRSSSCIIL